jgi:hypothetical protein
MSPGSFSRRDHRHRHRIDELPVVQPVVLGLGVNRARFYHVLQCFLSMPARVDLDGKKGSGAGHA